uniref:Uncharacterized protein n=1 Tax=uncultured organism TaxID=155900 RepID=Q1EHW9_9ZZZZ|nr:hypothetical protein 10D02-36 [uncultured organism]
MAEVDTSDALADQAESAYHDGEVEKAQELYRRSIGNTDPYGEQAAERTVAEAIDAPPEAAPKAEAEPAGPSPADVDQGMGGTRLADYKSYDELSEDERGQEFDRVFSLANPDVSESTLRRAWPGAEFDRNREFGDAALAAIPGSLDVLRVLEVVGLADHPDLIRWLVSVGRALASKPGDPTTIPITQGEGKQMVSMNTKQIEAKIDALQDEIDRAQALNDDVKSNRLYQEALALERLLPGGSGGIVDGVRTI